MTNKQKIICAAMTALGAIAAFLFLRLEYAYHLHFQEQNQMFLFSIDYFKNVVSIPGGASDYISRFLIQFFYYAGAGAGIIVALAAGVQLLTFANCSHKGMVEYALSFIPAGCLIIYMCDENALLSSFIAIILGLSFALLSKKFGKGVLRFILCLLSATALYYLCGSIAPIVFLAAVATRDKDWKVLLAGLALTVLWAYLASHHFSFPFSRLMFGTHYHRYHNVEPFWPWAATVSLCVILLVDALVHHKAVRPSLVPSLAAYVLIVGATAFAVNSFKDPVKEEMMKYNFLSRMEMWNKMIRCAVKKSPDAPMTVSQLNLALGMTEEMGEHMFEFFQNGVDGLFPPYERDFVGPIPTSEIYWHLGFVNTAQRFSFAAQEVIPDFQKSARCYKKLVETNMVNGAYDVSRKYLEPLKYTLFYRKWALETEKLLDNPDLIFNHPLYGRERAIMLKSRDFMYSDYEMDSMLGLLYLDNDSNRLALQYLLAWCLLKKDLDRFYECYSKLYNGYAGKSYQEGVLLYWAISQLDPSTLPSYISKDSYNKFVEFTQDYQSKDRAFMEKNYSDTYWFYYFYRGE